jgi:hypothetical protein
MKEYIALVGLALAAVLQACNKDQRPANTNCVTIIAPLPGLHPAKGRFVHPVLGTLNYQNVVRNYQATAPNTLQFRYSYTGATGSLDSTNLFVDVQFSTVDSSVTVRPATPAVTTGFDMQTPNPNWYDSCTGTLYLKFSWSSGTRKVTDTCSFN